MLGICVVFTFELQFTMYFLHLFWYFAYFRSTAIIGFYYSCKLFPKYSLSSPFPFSLTRAYFSNSIRYPVCISNNFIHSSWAKTTICSYTNWHQMYPIQYNFQWLWPIYNKRVKEWMIGIEWVRLNKFRFNKNDRIPKRLFTSTTINVWTA